MNTTDETYNGWTNRETWAVALHINNDEGWQEQVLEALREARTEADVPLAIAFQAQDVRLEAIGRAAEIVRENVENTLDEMEEYGDMSQWRDLVSDIGSMWRVNWHEVGASFLEDLDD